MTIMKIEVKDDLFVELAEELKTTPQNIVKIFLDHAKDLPHTVLIDAIQENSSLDNALSKLMRHAEVALTFGEIIEKIVGDHDYTVDDSGYNFEREIIWFEINFPEDDTGDIGSLLLQFGDDAGVIATASLKGITLTQDVEQISEEIYDSIDHLVNEDDEITFRYDWLEHDWLTFELQIDTPRKLDLPRAFEIEKMIKIIKKIICNYDLRKESK